MLACPNQSFPNPQKECLDLGVPFRVMSTIEQMLKDANMPGITCRQTDVSAGTIFGKKRDCLLVTLNTLKEYRMFIGARDVGAHLEVSWFMTIAPGFLKRAISKRMAGSNSRKAMNPSNHANFSVDFS